MPSARRSVLALCLLSLLPSPGEWTAAGGERTASSLPVRVEVLEDLPEKALLRPGKRKPAEIYREAALAFPALPIKYSARALPLDRSSPFVLRATLSRHLPAGKYEFRLRARGQARFSLDGEALLETRPQRRNGSGHDDVPPPSARDESGLRPLPAHYQEMLATVDLDGGAHDFGLVAVIGGKGLAPEPGELSVSFGAPGEMPRLLGVVDAPRLEDVEWSRFVAATRERHRQRDRARRREVSAAVTDAWRRYHDGVREWMRSRPAPPVPGAPPQMPVFNDVDRFIGARLAEVGAKPTPPVSDLEFLRRVTLDTVGLIPTPREIDAFLADPPGERRRRAIDRLLASDGWADHWVSYWQDVLAENPGILKPDLNNTGPFRWYLHQSFTDRIPFDRLVVELIEMEGSKVHGAPAGFGQATLNDAPMAAKADVLSQAFLGEKLSCARCHDAPFHPFRQKDLFGLAAMLEGKPIQLPLSSTVRVNEGARKPLVDITLRAGDVIEPEWSLSELVREPGLAANLPASGAVPSRRRLAALIVSPQNERFARVVVNRVWRRYLGEGLVEPAEDWSNTAPSHPGLLRYLAREFIDSGYDLEHVARLILSSHVYQRRPTDAAAREAFPEKRLFAGPRRRRLTAEQILDSLFLLAGKRLKCEELNLNAAGNRPLTQFLNLGLPRRAWEFTALSNERDRPALALPIAQTIVDVLCTFGWRQSRQNPVTDRDDAPSPLQTLLLANGAVGARIVRLSDDSAFTELCLEERPLAELVRQSFLRVLGRFPSGAEQQAFESYLGETFPGRRVEGARRKRSAVTADRRVSWSNHLSSEATVIRMEQERQLRLGDTPTERLTPEFRARFEDVLWALVNTPEFLLVP